MTVLKTSWQLAAVTHCRPGNFNGTIFAGSKYHSLINSESCVWMMSTCIEAYNNARIDWKRALIMQYGISKAVLTKKHHFFFAVSYFQADLTISTFSTVVSALVAIFKTAKIRLWSGRYPKKRYCRPCTENCSQFFFFSKPSAKMTDVGKLLWAQTSYIVLVWVQVYHWLP